MAGSQEVAFLFQFGNLRDIVTTNAGSLTFNKLKDLACEFINSKVRIFYIFWLFIKIVINITRACKELFYVRVHHDLKFFSPFFITFDGRNTCLVSQSEENFQLVAFFYYCVLESKWNLSRKSSYERWERELFLSSPRVINFPSSSLFSMN